MRRSYPRRGLLGSCWGNRLRIRLERRAQVQVNNKGRFRTGEDAEKLKTEGGGGFNPRIKPAKSARALAPEECFPQISLEYRVFPQPLEAVLLRLCAGSYLVWKS